MTQHSGVQIARDQAQTEARRAQEKLTAERRRLGDPGPEDEQAALTQLLARLGQHDPAAALREAIRDRDAVAARLQQALAALAPWRGDVAALATLPAPAPWQIEAWQKDAETTRQTRADAERAQEQARDALNRARAKANSGPAGVSLIDAAEARKRREAAWSAHRTGLTADSADRFETTLREDDRISGLLADTIAASHHEAEIQALDLLKQAESAVGAAAQTQESHLATVSDASSKLGLGSAPLATLAEWISRRETALQIITELQTADTIVTRASETRAEAAATLQAVLNRTDSADFEILRAEAIARRDAAAQRHEVRRALAAVNQELLARETSLREAQLAAQAWEDAWNEGAGHSLLAGAAILDAGKILDLLDRLGRQVAEHSGLTDRVRKMQSNLEAFERASGNVITTLGMPVSVAWSEVIHRLQQAKETQHSAERLQADLDTEADAQADDQAKAQINGTNIAALGAELSWDEQNPLRDHISLARQATGLRQDAADMRQDLAGQPLPEDETTSEDLKAREAGLTRDLELLRAETQSRFHELQAAKLRVDAVGGDDAVARIEAERANFKAAIAEEVRTHLADRMGLIALEYGLQRYRDEHRSGMLKRASDAFQKLSRGAYSGLAAEPDGTKEVLVATTAAGSAKHANDMSKGTRFQLYLALRMAGYHELAQTRPTVPFIADDIMETFDDDRSAEAFGLLGDMARTGQVIYLTHHQHLCDIAREVCPGAQITDLRGL